MTVLALELSTVEWGFDEDGMEFDPYVLFEVDRVVDRWTDSEIIPILSGVAGTAAVINSMLYEYYANLGNVAGVESNVMKAFGMSLETGSYLDSITDMSEIKASIKRFITTAMSSGYSRKRLNDGLKDLLTKGGILDKYFKTYLYDILSQYERSANKAMADDLGLKHFQYSGVILDDTRDFCMERAAKVFSVKEAKKWNDLHWKGKIEGVDVMIALGGYNCRHWVSYITEDKYNERIAEGNKGASDL